MTISSLEFTELKELYGSTCKMLSTAPYSTEFRILKDLYYATYLMEFRQRKNCTSVCSVITLVKGVVAGL